ncbi:hypothetical protein Q4E93_23715 [Flavitalea sp. BT771]|uniref:energy transducer TonB n=1 Tax=Flavitalea sp. BT771 TaxID=3063329 RepID=UPI0026E3F747|nr:energy transducer TonB [Flavitalea sp. BT771]MDO6433639.1 hypothetical protein [Flavitalea sp. BT771]MDV6222456.1 hypothetical protein [Flavitalea sp. BT771]
MTILFTSIFLSLSPIQISGSSHPNLDTFCDTCKKGKDTLTGRMVYLAADVEPECEESKIALLRRINKGITLPDSAATNDYQSNYVVGFIVEADGQITGERIIQDNTNLIGKQLLKVLKSCRWHPAKCNGKEVAMLCKFPITIDIGIDSR